MVLLTDFSDAPHFHLHAPYQQATGDYGSWDARRAFGGVHQAGDAGARAASRRCRRRSSRSSTRSAVRWGRVAILSQAHDSWPARLTPDRQPPLYPTRFCRPTRSRSILAQIDQAAERILAARKPVIIAGNGVRISQAYEELQKIAETAGLPVGTTAAGKGVFPETHHSLALGVFGTFGTPAANACIGEADLVLVLGSKLSPSDTAWANGKLLDPVRQSFIQVDIEPKNASWTFPAEQVVLGDVKMFLAQLW